jgi:hypothetical protein
VIVDPWDCWGHGQLFVYTAELDLAAPPR